MEVDGVPQVAAEEAAALAAAGEAHLVDVREPDELTTARVAGALHAPLGRLQEDWTRLPRDRPLVLLCAAGARSHVAARFLRDHGVDARNLVHGIHGWHRAGLPLES